MLESVLFEKGEFGNMKMRGKRTARKYDLQNIMLVQGRIGFFQCSINAQRIQAIVVSLEAEQMFVFLVQRKSLPIKIFSTHFAHFIIRGRQVGRCKSIIEHALKDIGTL